MTIVTQPYFFGHLDHLHKFRQWVKSAMFQPKSRRIPCIILWDSDQTTMCFMGQTCRSTSLSLSYFGKAVIPNHSQILLITDAPIWPFKQASHLHIHTVPLLWWQGQHWRHSFTQRCTGPSLSAMLAPTGGSSRPRSRHPAHHESKASSPPAGCEGRRRIHPTHPRPGRGSVSSTKNWVVSTSGVECFLKFKFLVNKNSSSPCCWSNLKSMTPPPS